MLPFVYVVHYAPRGRVNPYMNHPWKLVLSRTEMGALRKFHKRYPQYEAVLVMKL